MKRLLGLLLTVLMLASALTPALAYAESAGADRELENAIRTAKEKFSIPDEYSQFNYSVNDSGGKRIWSLSWSRKDGQDGGIYVSVDDRGTILNYSFYRYSSDYSRRKFPKVSREEALAIAEEFIKRINPDVFPQLKITYGNSGFPATEGDYYFNYIRMVNNVPFYENSVSVTVNRDTGEVQNYNLNWNDSLVFPGLGGRISMEEAQKAYREKLGLRLVYSSTQVDNKLKVFAAYMPKYGTGVCIDAFTGEKLETDVYGIYASGAMGDAMMNQKLILMRAAGEIPASLSPEELKAVEQVSKLLTQEEAEKVARNSKIPGLTDDYAVKRAGLSRDWSNREEFIWDMYFEKKSADKNADPISISVTLDAKTGEVRGFYLNTTSPDSGSKAKMDETQCRAAVEEFLKSFKPDRFSNTEFDDTYRDYYYYKLQDGQKPQQYTFRYVRKINGVLFPNNSITVTYDAVNGRVLNFNMNWYNVAFPSIDRVVSIDSVYDRMFSEIGLELQYKLKYPEDYYAKPYYERESMKPEIRLVYAVKSGKPLSFDANTGVIIDYSGEPYKESKPVEYTDISGHYAEKQIKALAEYGISLGGNEFKPDSNISQKDLLVFLSHVAGYYMPAVPLSDAREIDQAYSYYMREGIVREGEKAPESPVTREDAVKFLIRALKYDKVADINGIFIYPFNDINDVSPGLAGYIAIANGLKIIGGYSDGSFKPGKYITRAEAAVMIYNYLKS